MAVVSETVRQQVVTQAGSVCEYCLYPEEFNSGRFAVDHILPLTEKDAPLFHPRRDRWAEHFVWSSDFREIIGLTPTGRATVARLHTNHSGVVRQREVLYQLGLHPPLTEGT